MQSLINRFLHRLQDADAIWVQVRDTRGSVPRETGAWMAVFSDSTLGTIGGGRLEQDAIAHAQALRAEPTLAREQSYALGPSLGQCCGGRVSLVFEAVSATDIARLRQQMQSGHQAVALFGGGHVGHALVQVMSFSHAEDLDVVAACLKRQRLHGDLKFVGLIGSKTKWATFRQRLEARGFTAAELSHITSPIGLPGLRDKRPEVIAVSVAAQLIALPDWRPA